MAGILDILLDLPLLPARGRIAELGLEEIVAGHSLEAGIDLTILATADPIDRRAHVVIDPAPGNASQNPEGVGVGIEQHLVCVCLQRIGPHEEGAAVAELKWPPAAWSVRCR
ncbi:TnpA8 (fragment) [Mesorhizobium delmotii]|uniref:TnpA8 n=1 Tax=Mesorhizobium delmotii TaxID=1631247 RepID=A0A2P9AND7_9HYPH